jgi:hypothetical protein
MLGKLEAFGRKHAVALSAGAAGVAVAGYLVYKLLNPSRAFLDVDVDECPEQVTAPRPLKNWGGTRRP